MPQEFISVYSLTYAYKAKQVLDKNGVKSKIVSNSKDKLRKGCGYAIVVDDDIKKVKNILNQAGVKYN